jgi:hypothetical protein
MTLIQDVLKVELEKIRVELGFDNMNFYCSTPNEFVDVLLNLTHNDSRLKFPMFFVNSTTVKYNNGICTIGEMIIATKTDPLFRAEIRDEQSFKPILLPIYRKLHWSLKSGISNAVMVREGDVKLHYFYGKSGLYGYDGNKLPDYIDAIELNNFQIRIFNKCKL